MSVVVIIPARGGSKGVPRKNLRTIGSVPLTGHTVRIAKAAGCPDRIVVTTDDAEIASVASSFGAHVIERPAALATDAIMPEPAVIHALDELLAEGYAPEVTVMLQNTAPLTRPDDIDGAVELLLRERADCVFAAAPFRYFLWREDEAGEARAVNHDHSARLPRQDLPVQYVEAGSVYAMKTDGLRANRHRFFGKTLIYPISWERWGELDEEHDFVVQESRLRALGLSG